MKPPHVKAFLGAALLTFLIGCSQPVDNLDTTPRGVPEIPAVSLWPGMTSVDVRPVFPRELSTTKPIHAVMDIESLVYRTLTIQYRVQWLDAQGKILNPDGEFKILNMAPRTQARLDVIDPHGTAISWRAEFRPAM